MLATFLPPGVTTLEACSVLKEKYSICNIHSNYCSVITCVLQDVAVLHTVAKLSLSPFIFPYPSFSLSLSHTLSLCLFSLSLCLFSYTSLLNADTAIDLAGSSKSVRHYWSKMLCPTLLFNMIPASTVTLAATKAPASGATSEAVKALTNSMQAHSNHRKGDIQSVWGEQITVKNTSRTSKANSVSLSTPQKSANTNASKCKKMMTAHGILPGFSWGTLSIKKQR